MKLDSTRLALTVVCAALVLPAAARAVNLVPNNSFESYASCPTNLSNLYDAAPWVAPTTGTSDYFNACAPSLPPPAPPLGSYVSVPLNGLGYQQPLTGSGYGGMIVQSSASANYREYMQVPLSATLSPGATYTVTFNVSFSNLSDYAIDRLGAYFSVGAVSMPNYLPLAVTPQVESPAGVFHNDTANWVPVTGTFVAMGGETHMILGNFHDDATTNTQATGRQFPNCYYYVDDVSVSQLIQVDQACCLPNNQCILALPSECVSYGGTTQPIGVTCQQQPCGPVVPTPIVVDGLPNLPVGVATIDWSALTQLLTVGNIGSSGQDGVSIAHADGAHGVDVTWGNYDAEFATPGATHVHVLRGTAAGAAVDLVRLGVVTNPDNSETLTPDFSAVHATGFWVELLDELGAVTQRLRGGPAAYHIVVFKSGVANLAHQIASVARQKGTRLSARSAYETSAEVRYNGPVIASDGVKSYACSAVRFRRNDGDAMSSVGLSTITAKWPQGSPPGSFSIAALETDPPCAGLDCPNGPGTGTSLRAFQNALYVTDGSSLTERITVLPAVAGAAMRLRESPTRCCRYSRTGLGIVTTSNGASSAGDPVGLEWDAFGTVSGTESKLWHASATCSDGTCSLVPDFTSVGTGDAEVVYRAGGVILAHALVPPGGITLPISMLSGGEASVQAVLPGGPGSPAAMRIICITSPCPGWPVSVNGVAYMADQVDIEPVDTTPPGGLSAALDLTALEVSSNGFASLEVSGTSEKLNGTLAAPASPVAADFARPQLSPNPSAGDVRVMFAMPTAGRARVAVVDAAGRRVRGLGDGAFSAGAHSMSWDGRDEGGRRAPPGVYFVRVESGSASRVASVTRLR